MDGSMQQHAAGPILLYDRKEELMIVISNGYEDYALTVKGETFVWKV